MKQTTLLCVDAGGGHNCGLAVGLKQYRKLTTVWLNRNKHGLDYFVGDAKYGFNKVPKRGDEIIIVSCITWDQFKTHLHGRIREFLQGYEKVKIIVTDGRFARNPKYYNNEFRGFDVLTTACKRHFREPLPVRTYYQPFDLSQIPKAKPSKLLISHSPFVKAKFREKGTELILRTVKHYNADFDLITGVPWDNCLKRKARSHIFIDQVDHYDRDKFKFKSKDYVWPALGKSGIEAMHLGCCVITHGKGYDTDIPAPPVVWCTKETFPSVLKELINNPERRETIAKLQQLWAFKYASYDYAARNVLNIG